MDCDICGYRSNAKLFQKNACFSCIHFYRNTMRFGRVYKCCQKDSSIKCIILKWVMKWVMSLKVFNQLNKECRLGLFVNSWEQLFIFTMYAWPGEEIGIDFNENYSLIRQKLKSHGFSLEEIQSFMLSIQSYYNSCIATDIILHYHNLIQQTMYASHSTIRYAALIDSFQDVSLFTMNETILTNFFENEIVWSHLVINGLSQAGQ
jgi:hypothetical protein